MKKLVSSAAFAMLIALAGSATAPADNGPPGFVYEAAIQELALQADLNAPQYALAATVASNDFRAPAAVDTASVARHLATAVTMVLRQEFATRARVDNDVGWAVFSVSSYAKLEMTATRLDIYGDGQRDTGDSPAGAQRAQAA